ncbi:MAG: GNAT family N-acetyltransferase, partial [Actinobacteria bacterium]|nr:GNAT family N-acetyltransferase [Actinomycetota bacterium]
GDPPELVGWGGFKGPPADGIVELGYEIAEARRGRGLATAATRAMLAEAFADTGVRTVITHTLAHRNASNRVLEKAGFHHDAETVQDGEVITDDKQQRAPAPTTRLPFASKAAIRQAPAVEACPRLRCGGGS